MTKFVRVGAFLTAAAVLMATALTALAQQPSTPTVPGVKVVTLSCTKTWRGSAGGSFGGVPFSVSCNSSNDLKILEGVIGNDYTIRMGSENSVAGAFDCFWRGSQDSLIVNCGKVRLAIR